jgi:CheY-like chemotaxis protein
LLEPALAAAVGRGSVLTASLAAKFAVEATARLPELWRAANLEDVHPLRRITSELMKPAVAIGATRVADLCDLMDQTATAGRAAPASDLEPQLRQALVDTARAVRLRLRCASWIQASPADATCTIPAARVADVEPTPRRAVRVAVADDDPLARFAIEAMIEHADGLVLVGGAADVEQIVGLAIDEQPEVVVLDWMMPGGGGPEAARRILGSCPDTRIVSLSASKSRKVLLEMTRAGASGLVVKGGSAAELAQMIHQVVGRPA